MIYDIKNINKELISLLIQETKDIKDNHISSKIEIPFPNVKDIKNIEGFIDLSMFKINDSLSSIEVSKNQLMYLHEFIIENDLKLIKFTKDFIECIPSKDLYNSLHNINEFIEYEYQGKINIKNLTIPLYALFKININNKFTLNNILIGYDSYKLDHDIIGYDSSRLDDKIDIEILNYKPNLLTLLHCNIISECNKNMLEKYNNLLLINKTFINESFTYNGILEDYIISLENDLKLNVNITIYNSIIKDNGKIILKLTKGEYKIINELKLHISKGGISVNTLIKITNQTEGGIKKMIRRLNNKIKEIGYIKYIYIIYERGTKNYKLIINKK
ncbi:MAG: hypothetical protein PHH98_03085 [Candidatus Gracilibacteria bacterium]|nr:hypothetical protein [Candidatus Gracilibacteria bacterium]